MPHRRPVIRSIDEAELNRAQVIAAAEQTAIWFRGFVGTPLEFLTALKFQTVGSDPLIGEPLNPIEQVNQTFTILVALRAVERLFGLHPSASGFRLALTTSSGRDIESLEPDFVAAEVFAAIRPTSNRKLAKDVMRLAADPARHRYVFFATPGYSAGRQTKLEKGSSVEVHCVEI
jgi:hypothetical protein